MLRFSFAAKASELWPAVVIALGLSAAVLLLSMGSADLVAISISALINLILVLGLFTFIGNSGVLSFGHVSFMALGAYFTGLLTIPVLQKQTLYEAMPGFLQNAHLGPLLAVLVAAAAVSVVAYLVAIPLMRLNGIAAGIATLALLQITHIIISNWTQVFGPSGTLTGIPLGIGIWEALLYALAALTVAALFQRSRFGLRLRASREDEAAAHSVGVSVVHERRMAFTIGAALMAVGGGVYAYAIGGLSPDAFYFQVTFLTIAMLVVGGIHSLSGAVVGWALLSVVAEIFNRLEAGEGFLFVGVQTPLGLQQAVIAVTMVAVLIWRPEGLAGTKEIPRPRLDRWRRRHDGQRRGGAGSDQSTNPGRRKSTSGITQ